MPALQHVVFLYLSASKKNKDILSVPGTSHIVKLMRQVFHLTSGVTLHLPQF